MNGLKLKYVFHSEKCGQSREHAFYEIKGVGNICFKNESLEHSYVFYLVYHAYSQE